MRTKVGLSIFGRAFMESSNVPSVKQPTTIEEQIEIFKRRGLVVSDADFAIRTLQRISYYRLSAYTLSLKKSDQFYPNTTFENVVALYEFDRRFRYLIMEMVEQVEIAFRDRKSTRLNSSHVKSSYAVFCLKK